MNCRIRFIRIDGREMQVGANYNVVKDKSIDEPILRLVDAAKAFIADQLRVFTKGFEDIWTGIDDAERQIILILKQQGALGRAEIAKSLEIADRTISRKLNHLIELDAVSINGSKYDKNHTYSLNER